MNYPNTCEAVFLDRPNRETHPAFGDALTEAAAAGVLVMHLPCRVSPDNLEIQETGVILR